MQLTGQTDLRQMLGRRNLLPRTGVKGGGEWARGGCSALSTGAAGRLARARCERLLRACPPVLEISANSSLDGEVGDDSAEVAGSWRVAGAVV